MASIPISNIPNYRQYSASAGQTVFSYPFVIFDENDLRLYKRTPSETADDATQLLAIGLDYTVTGVGDEGGGTVVLTSPAAEFDVVTLVRRAPMQRKTNFTQSFTVDEVNFELNQQILLDQQNREDILARSVRYQDSATINVDDTKLPVLGAKQVWRKDAAGQTIQPFTIEIDNPPTDLAIFIAELASNGVGEGASLVGFNPAGTVQSVLAQNNTDTAQVITDLAAYIALLSSTDTGEGASQIGTDDSFSNVQASLDDVRTFAGQQSRPDGMFLDWVDNNELTVQPGNIKSKTDPQFQIRNSAPISKLSNAAWAEGSGNGGLADGVVLAPFTTYFIVGLSKDDFTFDWVFDTDINMTNAQATAAITGAGYTQFRVIGSARTAGASQFRNFYRLGHVYNYVDPPIIIAGTISPNVTYESFVPNFSMGRFLFNLTAGTPGQFVLLPNGENYTLNANLYAGGGNDVREQACNVYTRDGLVKTQRIGGGGGSWNNASLATMGYEYLGDEV